MKLKLILVLSMLLVSCVAREPLIITSISIPYSDMSKYLVTIEGIIFDVQIYTDSQYQVGDTITFIKK